LQNTELFATIVLATPVMLVLNQLSTKVLTVLRARENVTDKISRAKAKGKVI